MRILLTGGTGFIGQALLPALQQRDCEVTVLSRRARLDTPCCRFVTGLDEIDKGESFDAVINLAGASLADKRWTRDYKRTLVDSRLGTTRRVLALLERLRHPPGVLLSGSAVGYYGHHGDEILDESGSVTPGFAQRLCADWEEHAMRAAEFGVRTCLLRLGVVLDRDGGAFEQMARSFRLGVGSWIGSGRQWLSWIHREDVIEAILFLLDNTDCAGPYNLTAPEPVTSREICEALAEHYRTLLKLSVPAAIMRLALGEMADELLLQGQRVVPGRLTEAGFEFRHPTLESALAAICRPPG